MQQDILPNSIVPKDSKKKLSKLTTNWKKGRHFVRTVS
jgi:hypothetical protein